VGATAFAKGLGIRR